MKKLIPILISFFVSAIIVPLMILISKKFNLYDKIDDRKIHSGQISRLGGVGILLGIASAIIYLIFETDVFKGMEQNIWFLIPAAFLIIIMGIIDDIKNLKARIKLLTQIIAASLVIIGGFKFKDISIGYWTINLGYFTYPLTFCWIIGITNAINLIDGLDGLSGSISLISALTFGIFAYYDANMSAFYLCITLACAICGFLIYNLPIPNAKIFMGDGGSQFLGFALAIIPLTVTKTSSFVSLPYAIAILLIPIFDTIAAIWRRLREHRPINSPDRFHLHHKLLLLGFSKRITLGIIILLQILICTFLIFSLWLGRLTSMALLITVYIMGVLFFSIIHFGKNQALRKQD